MSELDLDKISDHIDLEMAINLGQQSVNDDAVRSFLNLNCHYDFKPTNFNFLVLSRLNFALQKKRIAKFVQKKIGQRRKQMAQSIKRVEEQEKVCDEI